MRRLAPFIILLLALLRQQCSADTPRQLVAAYVKADPRLAVRIHVFDADICFGDLFERASAETGITLRCGREDGSADTRVAVYCHDYPLKELLSALQSFASHNNAGVYWERTGKAGHFVYELRFPQNAQRLAERLRRETQEAFEKAAETLLRLAAMDPKERAKHAADITRVYMQNDEEFGKRVIQGERKWNGLNLFARSLTPDQQRNVISGAATYTLSAEQLPPGGKEFLKSVYDEGWSEARVRAPDGSLQTMPPPKSVMFIAPRDTDDVTRSLFVHLDTIGGYSYVGGSPLENAFIRKVRDLWLAPGESADAPQGIALGPEDNRVPVAPPTSDPAQRGPWPPARMPPLLKRLSEFSRRANVGVIGRIDAVLNEELGDVGNSVPEFLDRLANYGKGIGVKWSGRTLLLEEPQWFWTEENSPPWTAIKWFRQMMAERKDVPRFEDLCSVTQYFTRSQLAKTATECAWLPGLADIWPLLNACRERLAFRTAIVSEAGLQLTPEVRSILEQSRSLAPAIARPEVHAVQMDVKQWQAPGDSTTTSLMLDVGIVRDDGTRHGVYGLRIRAPRRP
jgi:hypothetical protein